MELDFLPTLKGIRKNLSAGIAEARQDLENFVSSQITRVTEPGDFLDVAKRIPEAFRQTSTGKFIASLSPKTKEEAFERGIFPVTRGFKPEGEVIGGIDPLVIGGGIQSTGKAVARKAASFLTKELGSIPFGFGRGRITKEVINQVNEKFGKEVGSRIIKEGGEELAQKAILKRGEETVTKFFAAQRPEAVKILSDAIRKAEPARQTTEELFRAERATRAARGEAILARGAGEKGIRRAIGSLKGELPKEKLDSIRDVFKQEQVDDLFDMIKNKDQFDFFDKVNTSNALGKLFKGQIPGTAELKQLQLVFGDELINTIRSKRPLSEKIMEGLAEVINIPRALMSSMDMSAPLRQGIVLSVHRPKQAAGAFNTMVRAFGSQRVFDGIAQDVIARPTFRLMKDSGLFLADITSTAVGLSVKEEAFLSNYATKIPVIGRLVKASERAYVGFLNKLRADVFDDMAKEFIRGGLTPDANPQVFRKLAEFVNTSTGRGSLGPFNPAAPILNGVFFSPRFMASRLQMLNPRFYMQLPQPVRVEAMKSMIKFIGTGVGILSLASLNDDIEVEIDPRSSDFGKIQMGNVRWDIWAGFQQWVRFITQATTGQIKGITSEEVRELSGKEFPFDTRFDLAMRFIRGKLAPVPALIVDQLDGQKNIIGQEAGLLDVKTFERVMPIYLQDMTDAVRELGIEGALSIGIPAFFGVGTQVFDPKELRKSQSGGLIPQLPKLPKLPKLPAPSF